MTVAASGPSSGPRTILVADDEPSIRALIAAALDGVPGCEVVLTPNGADCLAAARRLKPKLALIDVRMPGMNGHEVCAALRTDETLDDLIVVMLSAMNQPADLERARVAGADEFLIKPFDPGTLRAKVCGLLGLAA